MTRLLLALPFFLAAPASAQLAGRTIAADWWYPQPGASIEHHEILVGPGVELDQDAILRDDSFTIDVADDTVTFTFLGRSEWSQANFNGWRFADLDNSLPPIFSYGVDSASPGIANPGVIGFEYDENSFAANFAGLEVSGAGESITLRVTFAVCSADFNGDAFLDFFDYRDFVDCFESAACPPSRTADFNLDSFVDFFDYAAFVDAFDTGC